MRDTSEGRSEEYTDDREAVSGEVYIERKSCMTKRNDCNTYTRVHGWKSECRPFAKPRRATTGMLAM